MRELEARRARLLAQCELERGELAARVQALKDTPLTRLTAEVLSFAGERRPLLARPLTWVAALGCLLLLRRPSQLLTLLGWARTAVSFGSRAALVLKVLEQVRPRRGGRAEAPAGPVL